MHKNAWAGPLYIQGRAKSPLRRRVKYWLVPLFALRPNYCGHNISSRPKIFFTKKLIGRIINSFSCFWDISKIQKKTTFLMLDYNITSYLGVHHQTQPCSNLSWQARCLPVVASFGSFNSHASSNGSPCDIGNWIGRSVKGMANLQKKAQTIPHFYYIQCEADKVLDRPHTHRDFKESSGKDFETHGLNQNHNL